MKELPEWAKWMARDKDGTLWTYSKKPEKYEERDEWDAPEGFFDIVYESSGLNFPRVQWWDEEPTEVITMMTNHTQKGVEFNPIEPEHYNKGEIDLYESWYLTRPFAEFRAIMESIAERYMKRDKEDRIQDLDKCVYTLQRLREYEVLHAKEAQE